MIMKLQREPGRPRERAARKTAAKKKGNKTSASDLLRLEDTSESEVALDSLGSFFNHLIDTDYQQEDTEPVMEKLKR